MCSKRVGQTKKRNEGLNFLLPERAVVKKSGVVPATEECESHSLVSWRYRNLSQPSLSLVPPPPGITIWSKQLDTPQQGGGRP